VQIVLDIRHAFRLLRKDPGTTAIALVSLALGIGANTTVFSAVHAILLRPLPYREPDRVVQVRATVPARGWNGLSLSLADAEDFAHSPALAQSAVWGWQAVNLSGDGEPERVTAVRAGAGFFDVLGVAPALGRGLAPDEAGPGAPHVAVLSYGFWQRRFGGDPRVVGHRVTLDGVPTEVVGVMPRSFEYPSNRVEAWLPLTEPVQADARGDRAWLMVARLAPGVTEAAASQALGDLARRLSETYPATNQGIGVSLQGLKDFFYGPTFERGSLILAIAVLSVLLVACANIANLLLARAVARGRETALRAALGASRGRIVRQYLVESALLALAGGAAGLLVASWGMGALARMMPSVERADEMALNGPVLAFTLGLSLLSGVIFGLAPALRAAGARAAMTLQESGRGNSPGRRAGYLRRSLVVAEIAVALVLTMSAGLMVRSFVALRSLDPGYDPTGVLTLGLALPQAAYPTDSATAAFAERAQEALRQLPGAQAVAAASFLPASGMNRSSGFTIVGEAEPRPEDRPSANWRAVGPAFFQAFRVPLKAGRMFDSGDRMGRKAVVLVNEALVRRYFAGRNPLGAELNTGGDSPLTIVGVVADFHERRLQDPPVPTFFVPFAQAPARDFSLALRTTGDPTLLGRPAREAIHALDPAIPVANLATMATVLAEWRQGDWTMTRLLLLLAGVGLSLAVAGVFGVMAYTVTQRTGEIGVRVAMGASTADILRLVLGQGAALAGAGVAIGLVLSLAGTRALRVFLAGVSPLDPWTYLAVTLVLLGAVLLASWLPARRAARVDPITALRAE
jgi:predicted permease